MTRRDALVCLLLAGITLGLYWPARQFDLIYFDDPLFVTENVQINSGLNWHSLAWAGTGIVAANWHPLTNLTFLLTHQFFGENIPVEHLLNIFIHAANTVLLFVLLRRLTGSSWRSALVAAFFAWHPLRVESVAWIAERKDVLCAFFWLLSLIAYSNYARSQKQPTITNNGSKWVPYLLALVFCALALLSKPMAVTLPFTLLLLDLWPLGRIAFPPADAASPMTTRQSLCAATRLVIEKWPFFALTIIFCVLTFVVQKNGAAISSMDRTGTYARLANVIMSYLRYLGKAFWPTDLAVLYPFPVSERSYLALWQDWQLIAGVLVLLLFSILCLCQWKIRPYLAMGWFWFLGTMVPVIGFIQIGGQGMADRYTYLPLIGPTSAVIWFAAEFARTRKLKIIWTIISIGLLITCDTLTARQLNYWRDSVSLFTHTVQVTGDNYLAQIIIADGYEHKNEIRPAILHDRIAIALYPTDKEGFQALARLLGMQQSWAAAEAAYNSVLSLDPDDVNAHLGLADVLPHLGRNADAATHLEAALRSNLDSPGILNNLAWMLATSPRADLRNGPRAVTLAQHACELTGYKKTIFIGTLAAAYAEAGRFDDAITTAQRACDLAQKNGETALLQNNQKLLERYRQHKTAVD